MVALIRRSWKIATVANPPEQRIILNGVSWDTYERLLAERGEGGGPHFAYDDGTLEIVTTSFRHEKLKRALDTLVELVANDLKISVLGGGSTTFKRKEFGKGFEPEACFYIQHLPQVRGLDQIDLEKDPPPDLVIEIDIMNSSLDKFPIYSRLGIPEVWRYSGDRLAVFVRQGEGYVERNESRVLPTITALWLTDVVRSSSDLELEELMRRVRTRP